MVITVIISSLVYVSESLTRENRYLLRKIRQKDKEKGYKFKDYTVKGEVSVKKIDSSEYISINQSCTGQCSFAFSALRKSLTRCSEQFSAADCCRVFRSIVLH